MLRGTLSCHVIVVTYNDIMEFTISYLSLMSQRVMLRGFLMRIIWSCNGARCKLVWCGNFSATQPGKLWARSWKPMKGVLALPDWPFNPPHIFCFFISFMDKKTQKNAPPYHMVLQLSFIHNFHFCQKGLLDVWLHGHPKGVGKSDGFKRGDPNNSKLNVSKRI